MTTATEESSETMLVRYSVTDRAISELRQQFTGLTCETAGGYQETRKAIATLRTLRGDIEKRRQELKADALAWGRKVDGEAKRLTGMLLEIEEPLKAKKEFVDSAKERAEKAERDRLEAEERAKREAEQERLRQEAQRLAAERAELEAQRRAAEEAQRAAQEKIDAERRALDAERERLERIEAERAKRELAEQQAVERAKRAEAERLERERLRAEHAERQRLAAEQRAKQEAERAAAEAKLAEEMRPDVEKIKAFGDLLAAIQAPEVKGKRAKVFLDVAMGEIGRVAKRCQALTELK
jgi:hypothetical protein